jgi:hypothetical protein
MAGLVPGIHGKKWMARHKAGHDELWMTISKNCRI